MPLRVAARSRPGGRSARVRTAVIAAALDALLDGGPDHASVADIALRAGVHETSIYRRWGTREALLLDALLSRAEESLPVPDTGSLRTDLVHFLGYLAAFLLTPLGAGLARMSPLLTDDATLGATRRAYWSHRFDLARGMFDRAAQRGELPTDVDVDVALDVLIGPLYLRVLVTAEPLETDLAERVVGLVLDGLMRGNGRPYALAQGDAKRTKRHSAIRSPDTPPATTRSGSRHERR